MDVQSIRFEKKHFNKKEAEIKAKSLNYKTNIKPNPQYKNWIAYRQIQPELFEPKSYRTKKISKGIMLILGKLKKK